MNHNDRLGNLWCAICLYVRTDDGKAAETIIEGYAVCEDHVGYVASSLDFNNILRLARNHEAGLRS